MAVTCLYPGELSRASAPSSVTYNRKPVWFVRRGPVVLCYLEGLPGATVGATTVVCAVPEGYRAAPAYGTTYPSIDHVSPGGNRFRLTYRQGDILDVYAYTGADSNVHVCMVWLAA